ncbi:MAG: hypothetical protein Kow0056_07000 [Coriobacteriia bacterium]
MRILLLGPDRGGLQRFMEECGDTVVRTEEPISAAQVQSENIDQIVSYGYKHIVTPEVLKAVHGRAVNLHISLLPWNRGCHPNVWSFLEDTPKGVTIHVMDEGVDTGDILVQQEVQLPTDATLRTSYEILSLQIEALFKKSWHAVRAGDIRPQPQQGEGSFHKKEDLKAFESLLTRGWDTPVSQLIGRGLPEKGAKV